MNEQQQQPSEGRGYDNHPNPASVRAASNIIDAEERDGASVPIATLAWLIEKEMQPEFARRNSELVEALETLTDRYRATLTGKPVRDADEVIAHAQNLIHEHRSRNP